MSQPRVRFIGSRELHRELPKVLDSLDDPRARCVLTIHSKPRAVLIGAEAFLALLKGQTSADRLLALQLEALVQGHESGEMLPAMGEVEPSSAEGRASRAQLAGAGACPGRGPRPGAFPRGLLPGRGPPSLTVGMAR